MVSKSMAHFNLLCMIWFKIVCLFGEKYLLNISKINEADLYLFFDSSHPRVT